MFFWPQQESRLLGSLASMTTRTDGAAGSLVSLVGPISSLKDSLIGGMCLLAFWIYVDEAPNGEYLNIIVGW